MNKFVISSVAALALVAGAGSANGQTVAELQALIASLQSQIAALAGTTTTTTVTSSYVNPGVTLRVGSKGVAVTALQNALNNLGFNAGAADGIYGNGTAAAVRAFQASKGLGADGVAGNQTHGALTVALSGTTTIPTVPGVISGTEGDLTIDVSIEGAVTIDLGKSDTVTEFEVEAEDGDVKIDRVDFMFDVRPWLYFDEVNLLVDGKEVGSLTRSSDFSETNSMYRARFSNLNTIVKEGDAIDLTLEVKVLDSMAGTRQSDDVVVTTTADSIRYSDGSGAIMTGGEVTTSTVSFDDNFGIGSATITLGDNSPENATIIVDEDSRTNGVTVVEFEVEADDSDIEIQNVEVVFDTTSTDDVSDFLYKARLYKGSTLLSTKSVNSDSVIFDDIDFTVDEGDIEVFKVEVDFNKVGTLDLENIEVVSVKIDVEDEDYKETSETLTVNESHKLVVEGVVDEFSKVTVTPSQLGDNTIATIAFEFDLTAYENTFYIAEDASGFGVDLDGLTQISTTIASTNATLTGNAYRINKGQTRTFKVEVKVEASAAGTESGRIVLDDIEYFTNAALSTGADTLTLGAPDYRSASVTVFKQ